MVALPSSPVSFLVVEQEEENQSKARKKHILFFITSIFVSVLLFFPLKNFFQFSETIGTDGQEVKRTDYSYQFSKQLFNDKINVKVGGRISSGIYGSGAGVGAINEEVHCLFGTFFGREGRQLGLNGLIVGSRQWANTSWGEGWYATACR